MLLLVAVTVVRDGQTESAWSVLRAHEYPVIWSIRYCHLHQGVQIKDGARVGDNCHFHMGAKVEEFVGCVQITSWEAIN